MGAPPSPFGVMVMLRLLWVAWARLRAGGGGDDSATTKWVKLSVPSLFLTQQV